MLDGSLRYWLGALGLATIAAASGWLIGAHRATTRDLAVQNLSVRHMRLTDDQGRTRAELKTVAGETSMTFLDSSNRERLTLVLGDAGVAIRADGRDATNQILLSINDALRTGSVFVAANTAAINLVGSREAQLKISDSLTTDSRSASLSVGSTVTKLRLSSAGAEAQLLSENKPIKRAAKLNTRAVELNLRTAVLPEARLRVSSDEKPIWQIPVANHRTLAR